MKTAMRPLLEGTGKMSTETRQLVEFTPADELVGYAENVADLAYFRPETLIMARSAAEADGLINLEPVEFGILSQWKWLKHSERVAIPRSSCLKSSVKAFLHHVVGLNEDGSVAFRLPVEETHPAFQRILQALKTHGIHNKGPIRFVDVEF